MSKLKSLQQFIIDSQQIHGNKYDYSKVSYLGNKKKVELICSLHGSFYTKPNDHITQSQGCPRCGKTGKLSLQEFVNKSNSIHNFKYDYSLIQEYINNKQKVSIICPKHGEFMQTTKAHYSGQGCPKCRTSKLENELYIRLLTLNVTVLQNYSHKYLNHSNRSHQHFDFFLPDYNIAIECNGKQHYESVIVFGGESNFRRIKELDELKRKICTKYHIRLLEYPYFFKKAQKIMFLTTLKEIINGHNSIKES